MKHIGIVGVTAEGASLCYRTIVAEAEVLLGRQRHPQISLHSRSLREVNDALQARDFHAVAGCVLDSVKRLQAAGADLAIVPANAPHYAWDEIAASTPLPMLSIVEETVREASRRGFTRVAILGIGLTMSDGLYDRPLREVGIVPVVPSAEEQEVLNRVIFDEIIPGRASAESARQVVGVIERMQARGCDGVGLCCTELPLVVTEANAPLPFIDTTRLLAMRALQVALEP
jgi:aspartate racemase